MTTPEGPNPVRLELGLTEPDLLVLYAGNMGAKQGLGVLIQAGLQLADTPGIQFLMVGDGSARLALQDQAQGLSGMRWWPLQPKNRLNDLLHAADIHVLPQLGGAADLVMPSKLGPMLASGKLVIGTAEADTELGRVLDAVGLRVQPEDPMALANAIRQAAARPAWRAERGAMGRAYVAAHLDKRTVLAAFEQQCHQLLAA